MGGISVILIPNTSSATSIILLLPTARALSSVGLLLELSASMLLFVVVGITSSVMTEH